MVPESIRQAEDHLWASVCHHLAYLALLLSGIGGLVPCAASTDSVYPNLYTIAIPHDIIYSVPYSYPITHTDP